MSVAGDGGPRVPEDGRCAATLQKRARVIAAPALLLGVALLLPQSASGMEGEPLTLGRLLEIAAQENPEIRASEAQVRAMEQRPIQEQTLPDPTVGVRFHNERFSRFTFGESDFSFLELSVEQEVPYTGKLRLRGQVASREAEREGAMRDLTVLMILAEVAARYADLAAADRSAEILGASLRTLDLIVEQANAHYAVGTAVQQDVLRATLERGGIRERLTMLGQKRAAAVASINALLNRAATSPLPVTTWSDATPALPPLDTLIATIAGGSPSLKAAELEVLRREAALELARREYYPDFAFMGAYMNKGGLAPEWELGVRIRIPLYYARRQRAGVAEAAFARSAAESSRQNTEVRLGGRLAELYSMGESAVRLLTLYRETLIPQAELTLESARVSYEVSKVDLLTLLNAFTALLEYRLRSAEEAASLHRVRAEMAPLLGEPPVDDWGR